jgi:2-polyprenyl-6-methoxyphenol hydroxylase-like FAD-dependent oxidoreductase
MAFAVERRYLRMRRPAGNYRDPDRQRTREARQRRLALVGDAAHVQTPMTGQGFSSALEDAEALAESIAAGLRRSAMTKTLADYERKRLSSVRSMVRSGQQFSRSFTGRAA